MTGKGRPPGTSASEATSGATRRDVVTGLACSVVAAPLAGLAQAASNGQRPSGGSDLVSRGHARGTPPYEDARQRACWSLATPPRYPDLIIQARSAAEVAEILRYARARHMTVAVKGSGHNYTSTYLRDGGILLDMSTLREVRVDPRTGDAWAQAGITSGELSAALTAQGRAFPTGHHAHVGLGGFLLGGGMGWNGESWGQFACFNVKAVDVVTADGRSLTVSAGSHPELYWAARGGGPLFCAVATGFHLATFPAPAILASQYTGPLASAAAVARWLRSVAERRLPNLDMFVLMLSEDGSSAAGVSQRRQTCLVYVLSYGADRAAAEHALRVVADGAPRTEGLVGHELEPVTFADLYAESLTGPARRTAADTAWSHDALAVTTVLAQQYEKVPSAATVGIINYRMPPRLPAGAACSMAGSVFVQWLGQWDRPADDEANLAWVADTARLLDAVSVGSYINESDILRRPERLQRCFTAPALARLATVRATYDPTGLLPPPIPI